jgi:hypothetical protein
VSLRLLGSASSIAGSRGASRVAVASMGSPRPNVTRTLGRERPVEIRVEGIPFELVTTVVTPAVIVNVPSALVSSSNTPIEESDEVETNIVAVAEVEYTILVFVIVLGRFGCPSRSSHVGY